jgi:predicted small secreted protein
MKTRTSQFLLIALFTAIALLLSACQVNFITDI